MVIILYIEITLKSNFSFEVIAVINYNNFTKDVKHLL